MRTNNIFQNNTVHCPGRACSATPHIIACACSRPGDMSGICLEIDFKCEAGHSWAVKLEDHSGGVWVSENKSQGLKKKQNAADRICPPPLCRCKIK